MAESTFLDFVLDQLRDLPVRSKPMFGGVGLYLGDDFFAIVYDDRLYLRTNDETRAWYEDLGAETFKPNAKQEIKSYLEVPPDVVEDRDTLVAKAVEAAETHVG